MAESRHPLLYQLNTRVRLSELSAGLGRAATLDDLPEADLDWLAESGFSWVWLLSVWQTGPAGRFVSRGNARWRQEFQDTLPDLAESDIGGSGFAIADYRVHDDLGGEPALSRLRQRLRQRGLKLMLDFVPNHTALDHHWLASHPEYYIEGSEPDLAAAPQNYTRIASQGRELIVAHGRDPYFPGWPDTLQLNYANPFLQESMKEVLLRIAERCDGVRCDMAMLVLPDVFERTWGMRPQPFWPAVTAAVRAKFPGFIFMAEVYWDMEWTLQQQGFDYTYDKRLYDRLRDGHARPVREHFYAPSDYQSRMARFLENHDEPRAAATFAGCVHRAAATITFLAPGLRFFHQGQIEGKIKRISPHLTRGPQEPVNEELKRFYESLLALLREPLLHQGKWQLLECAPAWEGNWTWDCFIAFAWLGPGDDLIVVAVNYAPNQSQCYVRLPFAGLAGARWHLQDSMSAARYERDGQDLCQSGLYLDVPAWTAHAFKLAAAQAEGREQQAVAVPDRGG